MTHEQIRQRDRKRYCRENGPVPEGYTIHHLYYSEEYDQDSFVIVTPEEHSKLHNKTITTCSEGANHTERNKERCLEYYYEHKEKLNESHRKWLEEHREQQREYMREHRKRMKYREKLIKMGVI